METAAPPFAECSGLEVRAFFCLILRIRRKTDEAARGGFLNRFKRHRNGAHDETSTVDAEWDLAQKKRSSDLFWPQKLLSLTFEC